MNEATLLPFALGQMLPISHEGASMLRCYDPVDTDTNKQ